MNTIQHKLAGIPCLIEVTNYVRVAPWPGSAQTCDSSDDFHGYTEYEYNILDRRGRKAPWLEQKSTPEEKAKSEQAIDDDYASPEDDL